MRRLIVFIATLLFAGMTATDSQACSPAPLQVRPGESGPQALLRRESAAQAAAWNRADFVALALVKASWLADGHVTSQLIVVVSVKGSKAPHRMRFADPGICGPGPRLDVGRYVLIYGFWARDRLGPIEIRRPGFIRVVPLDKAVDPRVPAALRDTAKRLRGDP